MIPNALPEFPIVRRMTLEMASPCLVPSVHARRMVERQQRVFMHGWDPLFFGFSLALVRSKYILDRRGKSHEG